MEDNLSIRIVPDRTGDSAGVAGDYLRGAARSFYPSTHLDLSAYRVKLREVSRRFGPEERRRAAAALRPTSARARERLQRFVDEGGAVVTTGQQAGFLTGPLYTVYKALTAVRLADALERELGIIVLPVFWTASEDHDWDEVNHATLGTRHGARKLQLHSNDPRVLPMSARTLEENIETTLDELSHLFSYDAHADDLLELIRDAYRPGVTVADAFSTVMAALLAPFDLLLTDAADPAIKRASVPVLRAALEEAGAEEKHLGERVDLLRAAGYPEQVTILDGATNVFYSGSGERERLYRRGTDFGLPASGRPLGRAELLLELERQPELFSPNVLLRPIVESTVFPTLAYVGGPGEIAYFAQLGVLFPLHGMTPPIVFPRFGAVLVERWVDRDLKRLGMSLETVGRPRHELVETMAREAMPEEVARHLTRLGDGIAEGYRGLIESAEALDPMLRGSLGGLRNEMLARLGRSERKILRSLKRRERETIERLDGVRDALFPEGTRQERVLNILPFLARDRQLLERLLDSIEISFDAGSGGAIGNEASASDRQVG